MKLSKTKMILLGIGSAILLGTGIYLLVRTKKDEENGGSGDNTPPPPPPVEPTNVSNGDSKELTYAECKAKNPFKTKQEVINFQKYAISKSYDVGNKGADGDYGCKTDKAYEALKDSYKAYLAYQSTVAKTQNEARQKAIQNKYSTYLWDSYVYRTSDNAKLEKDPRGKSLYIKSNVNEVNVRITASNSGTIANGLSNYSGVIKNQGGKKVATIRSYAYNDSEKRMYYMVDSFLVTLYDRNNTSKPIVNPKAGYVSSNSSEAK